MGQTTAPRAVTPTHRSLRSPKPPTLALTFTLTLNLTLNLTLAPQLANPEDNPVLHMSPVKLGKIRAKGGKKWEELKKKLEEAEDALSNKP